MCYLDNIEITQAVALRKESVDRNAQDWLDAGTLSRSLSARRAWIEIIRRTLLTKFYPVALRKESVDRNSIEPAITTVSTVALRKESVDRNPCRLTRLRSLPRRSPQGERG